MKIIIVYDNEIRKGGLKKAWGFSCLIEKAGFPLVMFDTGADGLTLLYNLKELEIDMCALCI